MSKRKSFRVEMITTKADGSIVLEGEGRAIRIQRVAGQYSTINGEVVIIAEPTDHSVTIAEYFAESNGSMAF